MDRRSPPSPNEATDKVSLLWYVDRIQDDIPTRKALSPYSSFGCLCEEQSCPVSGETLNLDRRTPLYPYEAPEVPSYAQGHNSLGICHLHLHDGYIPAWLHCVDRIYRDTPSARIDRLVPILK